MIFYVIGRKYRHQNESEEFTLKKAGKYVFTFACGHWCTDHVFRYMIDCETGEQVRQYEQLSLF